MNIGSNTDGLSREQRMATINDYSNVLSGHKRITQTNIDKINFDTDLSIRNLTTVDKYNTIVPPQAIIINDAITNITNTTNIQSNLDIIQITTDSNTQSAVDIQDIKDVVNLEISNIITDVNNEIAALTANGTPPTPAKQDEMFRIAFGYPSAVDAAAAQQLYYDNNVKTRLGYPSAADVATAETLYTEQALKTNLGFPNASTVLDAENSYRDLQLKIAFGFPDASDAAAASQAYYDKSMSTFLGFPNAKTLVEAEKLWYDNYMNVLISKPELILVTVSKSTQDQMYKDAFGYPTAPSVLSATNSYRAAMMKSLLDGVDITIPPTFPKQRTDMDIVHQEGIKTTPEIPRIPNPLPPQRIAFKQMTLNFYRDTEALEARNQVNNNKTPTMTKKTEMSVISETITRDERVYGLKPTDTPTLRSSMAINPNNRTLITREQRLNRNNSYSTLYKHAEAIVKKKVIKDAANNIFYTDEQVKQMVYDELKK